ncbi:hypothetical protein BDQ17DRAFT_1392515 [Cyathus striatus]|nr:hypothetical protein BDQ17DRAFT_1392515 [Cyathus striatus]
MDLYTRLRNVQKCLEDNDFTISTFIQGILNNTFYESPVRQSLVSDAVSLCITLYERTDRAAVFGWASSIVKAGLCMEIDNLSRKNKSTANNDEPKSKRAKRAVGRNTALLSIKAIVMISIFLQSTNERCNYLQSILGIFFHSNAVPERVVETLAHTGLSISLTSIHNAINSLSEKAGKRLEDAVGKLTTAFAYDNFDCHFKTSEPTVEQRSSTFVSATSATAIPLVGVTDREHLRCSDQLWDKDPLNPSPTETPVKIDLTDIMKFHLQNSANKRTPGKKFSALRENFAWHVRDILIRRAKGFEYLMAQLGQPEPINKLTPEKTVQIPCRAMNIKESTPDGNIEVVENLLRQGRIGEPGDKMFHIHKDVDMTGFVILIHGDLLTKERLDAVRQSRRIEETPKR